MNFLIALFISIYPHINIEASVDSLGLYFAVHTPHISTDFNLFVSELSFTKDSVLNYSYPDFNLWDRNKREDSIFIFRPTKRRKFKLNTLYAIRATVFDLKKKNTIASPYFLIRLNKEGKIGISPSLYPIMQLISKDTLGIFFESNKPSYATITLLFHKKDSKTIIHSSKTKRHEFKIPFEKGLKYYKFTLYTEDDTFVSRTIPIKYRGKIETFAAFGDTRANWAIPSPLGRTSGINEEVINDILREIYKENPDLIVINGDLISGYTNSREDAILQYYSFLKSLYPYASSIPFLFTAGNHDMTAPYEGERKNFKDPKPPHSAEDLWAKIFMQPENGPPSQKDNPPYIENVYYISSGDWGIFFLNSDYNYAKENGKRVSGNITLDQMRWYMEVSKRFKNSILIFHEPLYSNTGKPGHSLDYDIPLRDSIVRFIFKSNPRIIITSHEHLYARRKIQDPYNPQHWIYQVTIGAGGAPLYNIPKKLRKNLNSYSKETTYLLIRLEGNRLIARVKNLNGFIIDSFKSK